MLIKILLHLGVVDFLVKILLGFMSEEVGMIASLGGSVLEVSDHMF